MYRHHFDFTLFGDLKIGILTHAVWIYCTLKLDAMPMGSGYAASDPTRL